MNNFLLLFLVLSTACSVEAATYYVRTDGSDSNGGTANTAGGAWLTIQKAANTMVAGDTVIINAGTYLEKVSETTSGTAGNVISYIASGTVTVDQFSTTGDYVNVHNLRVDSTRSDINDGGFTLNAGASFCVFSNCVTTGSGTYVASGAGGFIITSSTVSNCTFTGGTITNPDYHACIIGGTNNTVTNSTIVINQGWDVFRIFYSQNTIISGNTITASIIGANPNHPDIIQAFGDNSDVVQNLIFEKNYVTQGVDYQLGNITDDQENGDISNWTFRNNLFVDVARTMNLYAPNFNFYHNTFVRCGPGSSWAIIYGSSAAGHAHGLRIVNNIFEMCGDTNAVNKGWYGGDVVTNTWFGYNLVRGNTAKTGYTPEAGSVKDVNPLLSATTYKPATNSPVLNAGTNLLSFVSIDFDGLSRDSTPAFGAFEASGESEDYTPTIVTNNASGARVMGFRNLAMAVLPPPPSPYLLEQDFEGTGYDRSQTWAEVGSGTLNEDYTSTVLVGSQSMLIDLTSNIGDTASPLITMPSGGGDIWYVYFQLRVLTFPSSGFRVATVTNSFDLSINASSNLVIRPQVGTGVATVGKLEAGITYHVWMQGSGNDIETAGAGTARVGFSSTGIRPTSGDNYAIDTDVSANGPFTTVQLTFGSRQVSANYSVIIDKVRMDNDVIGDNPQ